MPNFTIRYGSKQMSPMLMIVVGYVFTVVSILMVVFALVFLCLVVLFLPGSVTATSTITHCTMQTVEQTDSRGHPNGTTEVCLPTVRFTTQAGRQITFTPANSSDAYHVGDTLPVRYHPNTPQDARLDDFGSTWLPTLILGGMSVIFFIVGQSVLRVGKKRRKAESMF